MKFGFSNALVSNVTTEYRRRQRPAFGQGLRVTGIATLLSAFTLHAADLKLKPETKKAWDDHIQKVDERVKERCKPGRSFLALDETPDLLRKVKEGEILVTPVDKQTPRPVPSGLIHDWMGAAFIPDAKLNDVFSVVSDYNHYKEFYKPTVVDSKTLSQSGNDSKFFLMLLNKSLFLKTALEGDYQSTYIKLDEHRGYSISYTTRIQEIREYGRSEETKLPVDEGSGLIWRLYSVSRFEERDGGVFVELEAVGLSREVPSALHWLVDPIVRRVSKNSLAISLRQTQGAVRSAVQAKGHLTGQAINSARTGCQTAANCEEKPLAATQSGTRSRQR